jgi:hypothetical protein
MWGPEIEELKKNHNLSNGDSLKPQMIAASDIDSTHMLLYSKIYLQNLQMMFQEKCIKLFMIFH